MQSAERPGDRPAPLPRAYYDRDALRVAPQMLNKLLVRGERSGRIVEVEAYRGAQDPASHAFKGPTRRNATMFGPPGHLYVYFTYGMHWCANAVCGAEGIAMAVLIRALAPVAGIDAMRDARPHARKETDLASGPAKLCQALGISGDDDGADLVTGDRGIMILDDGMEPPCKPGISGRIGIRAGAELPWRWWVRESVWVSRPAAH
ncbi:MAG: DNA-3-methyladenine glycosylase [Acidimicrobiales bacterium]